MTNRKPIVTFAVAYHNWHQAIQEGNENGQIVYQDMLVDAADALGLADDEMHGLRDHRAEKKRRDDDAFAAYCARHPAMGDQ